MSKVKTSPPRQARTQALKPVAQVLSELIAGSSAQQSSHLAGKTATLDTAEFDLVGFKFPKQNKLLTGKQFQQILGQSKNPDAVVFRFSTRTLTLVAMPQSKTNPESAGSTSTDLLSNSTDLLSNSTDLNPNSTDALSENTENSAQKTTAQTLDAPALTQTTQSGFSAQARLGLIVAKKAFKRANKRNRFKRVVREWFRLALAQLPDYDIVIIARAPAKPSTTPATDEIYNDLANCTQLLKRFAHKQLAKQASAPA